MSDLHDKLTNLSPAQKALDAWTQPAGEPFSGKTYIADGWVYRDLPRLSHAAFKQFVDTVGEGNIRWMTLANYGDTRRGQCLISPAGQANLQAFVEGVALADRSVGEGKTDA